MNMEFTTQSQSQEIEVRHTLGHLLVETRVKCESRHESEFLPF